MAFSYVHNESKSDLDDICPGQTTHIFGSSLNLALRSALSDWIKCKPDPSCGWAISGGGPYLDVFGSLWKCDWVCVPVCNLNLYQ